MSLKLLYALIATILPGIELRGGMPLAIIYARESGVDLGLIFFLVVLLNILLIFFVFYFLDEIHCVLTNFKFYRRISKNYFNKIRNKTDKFEKRHNKLGFLALVLFVSIPLPGTGVWSGGLLSWLIGLDRRKSVLSMSLGVLISGTLVLIGTLGFMGIFS